MSESRAAIVENSWREATLHAPQHTGARRIVSHRFAPGSSAACTATMLESASQGTDTRE